MFWDNFSNWKEANEAWEQGAREAETKRPLKKLKVLPDMPGITPDTAKGLKWKSFKWMVTKDHERTILRGFLKHPFKYSWRYFKSFFQKSSFKREGDFFFYGIENEAEFKELLKSESLFVLGFSYCHKPFECPSGRFTEDCMHDPQNAVCRQCFIGKAVNASSQADTKPLFIPTVHYIAGKIFELLEKHPDKQILFLITACEMTLQMFGDWGNMAGIKGIGVRLDGRICNTMKAFELSEQGIKPGLTVVLEGTQERMLEILRQRRKEGKDEG